MDCMCKGVGGWEGGGVGGGDGWATGDALYLSKRLFGVAMSPRSANDRPSSPDKPRGPKRRLTNTGVNIRPIPPI